jgi:predicted transposase YdaD
LEISKDSFIEKDLAEYYSDILYKVNLTDDSQGFICVLFEHKSYYDKFVHLQLLEYMIKIWRLHIKQHKTQPDYLPIVIPLLICYARKEWPEDTVRFTSLLSGPVEDLVGYIPDFGFELYDLHRFSDDEIKGTIASRVILLLLKHIRDPDLLQKLPDILVLMRTLMEKQTGLQWLEVVILYLAAVKDEDDLSVKQIKEITEQAISKDMGEYVMTSAEKLRYPKAMRVITLNALLIVLGLRFGVGPHQGFVFFVRFPTASRQKIIFVSCDKKRGWLALLSTDLSLPNEEIIRLYGKRWDIEVFFKMCKQHLKLVKEIQIRNYDGLIAHTSFVIARYNMLSLYQRQSMDQRSFGGLFRACNDEMTNLCFVPKYLCSCPPEFPMNGILHRKGVKSHRSFKRGLVIDEVISSDNTNQGDHVDRSRIIIIIRDFYIRTVVADRIVLNRCIRYGDSVI